jgi:DNA polymerase-3 subunit delta'
MALKDVTGQDKAVGILLKTVQRGRISSSYLFAGESGIGKKFTAVNLAKTLNCLGRDQKSGDKNPSVYAGAGTRGPALFELDACDECPSCRKIDAGIHPDFLLVSPEGGQIRVEEIRAIDDSLSFTAFEGRYKIVIVDEADTMNQYAANAFLKTLEEPPESSLIILISSNPDRLPDTIRSRCSRINFVPLSLDACREIIRRVIAHKTADEGHKRGQGSGKKKGPEAASQVRDLSDPIVLSLAARLSMGRPGIAISGDLIEDRTWFIKLLGSMLDMEKDGWTSRQDMEKWFDFVLILLRDMAVLKITGDEKDLVCTDLRDFIAGLSNSMKLKVIIEHYQELNTLRGYLKFNLNKSLTWNFAGSLLRKDIDTTYA